MRLPRLLMRLLSPAGDGTILSQSTIARNCKIGKQSYLFRTTVGDYSYSAGFNSFMNAEIGKFCSIGEKAMIGPGRHPANTFVSTSPVFFSGNLQCGATFSDGSYFEEMGKVRIGNDVWIGANATILDDVTIGDGAIVGAGAVVTKDVAPYSIVVGVPAKHLKFRFDEDEIAFLLRDRWWDKDVQWLKENFVKFHNIKDYIKFIQA